MLDGRAITRRPARPGSLSLIRPMELHVLRELRQPIGSVTVVDLQERSLPVDDTVLQNLRGSATLLRTDRGLLVTLDADALADMACSRCLATVQSPISIHFEEEYVPVVDANTGAPVRVADGDDVFRIGPDFVLNLREGVREYILISEPFKPLCRPDCAGLCPQCGADLNLGPCGCAEAADERWRALAGLRTSDREGS